MFVSRRIRYVLVQQLLEPTAHPIKIHLNIDDVHVGRCKTPHLSTYSQVSRDHALFLKSNTGSIFAKDLNSRNGLYINGIKIGAGLQALNVGDIVGFGVPSLEKGNGFVCALEEAQVEVIDLTCDESEICVSGSGSSSESDITDALLNRRKRRIRKISSSSSSNDKEEIAKLCKEILDDENLPPVSIIQENNDYVETVEDIIEFLGSYDQKCTKESGNNNLESEIGLILECDESDASCEESSIEEEVSKPYFSVKIPLGENIIQNSSEKCEDSSFNYVQSKGKSFNKSSGRALTTEAKPLKQRPRNIRGREEGFTEKKKYQSPNKPAPKKQSQRSNKSFNLSPKKVQQKTSAAVKVQRDETYYSQNKFKIIRKSDVRIKIKRIYENGPSTSKENTSNANSKHDASSRKKIATVKRRPEKFGSRMSFLVEDSKQNSRNRGNSKKGR